MRLERQGRAWQPELSIFGGVLLLTPGLILLALLFLWPLAELVSVSLPDLSLNAYRALFSSQGDVRALIRTFLSSLIVTFLAVAIGLFLAWEMRATRSRLKRTIILLAALLPLWMSVILRNYALTIIFQREGILNHALIAAGIRDQPLAILYTQQAVILGILYTLLPYAVLPLYASFVNIDLELVRAARTLGASAPAAFRTVVLPLALPSIIATAGLVFVLSLGFYITPILLGSANAPFVANRISNSIFVFFDLGRAAAAGVVLLGAALVSVGLTLRAVGLRRLQQAMA